MKKILIVLLLMLSLTSFLLAMGGPDYYGYRWKSNATDEDGPQYGWIQHTPNTSEAPLDNLGDDDYLYPLPIGFDFPFYGETYSSFNVSSNGFISFLGYGLNSSSVTPFPYYTNPNATIGWFFHDLNPAHPGTDPHLYYEVQTLADDEGNQLQACVISFVGWHDYGINTTGVISAQVVLYENGEILIQYGQLDGQWTLPLSIGIEDAGGQGGLSYYYNAENANPALVLENPLGAELAIKIYKPLDTDLSAWSFLASQTVGQNVDTEIKATIANIGFNSISGDQYTVNLYLNDNTLIGSLPGVDIAHTETAEFNFIYAFENLNEQLIHYEIVLDGDEDPENNISSDKSIYVIESGSLQGYVRDSNNNPIEGATVSIVNTAVSATTDENGFYEIPHITGGSNSIQATKFAYSVDYQSGVEIYAGQVNELDFVINLLNIIDINGRVVTFHDSNIGVPNADITVSGYSEYSTTTDDEGYFVLEGLYAHNQYTITVNFPGYIETTYDIYETENNDYQLPNIYMQGINPPPTNVIAQNVGQTYIPLSWNSPELGEAILEGYSIYRSFSGASQDSWTLIADNIQDTTFVDSTWYTTPSGIYTWKVFANYPLGLSSSYALSEEITQNRTFSIYINVEDANSNLINNAVVSFVSPTVDFLHYEATTSGGAVSFPAIWSGVYNYTVTHPSYPDSILVSGIKNILSDNEYVFTIPFVVGIEDNINNPIENTLFDNYPNPFNPITNIKFSIKQEEMVTLEIFNTKGQKVKTLINKPMEKGVHTITWYGKDENDNNVGSGIYFYKLKAGRYTSTKKMILLK